LAARRAGPRSGRGRSLGLEAGGTAGRVRGFPLLLLLLFSCIEEINCHNWAGRTVAGELVRVVDPYSFFPDPDPEFDVGDQYGSGSGSNPDPGL
jgi:hypothetical protein